jgi:hypothetical protein
MHRRPVLCPSLYPTRRRWGSAVGCRCRVAVVLQSPSWLCWVALLVLGRTPPPPRVGFVINPLRPPSTSLIRLVLLPPRISPPCLLSSSHTPSSSFLLVDPPHLRDRSSTFHGGFRFAVLGFDSPRLVSIRPRWFESRRWVSLSSRPSISFLSRPSSSCTSHPPPPPCRLAVFLLSSSCSYQPSSSSSSCSSRLSSSCCVSLSSSSSSSFPPLFVVMSPRLVIASGCRFVLVAGS